VLTINRQLHIFSDTQQLGRAAAEHVARLSAEAMLARGRFTIALSGGSLPKLISPALVSEPLRSQMDWSAWHVFFADERCVPLDHPDSNYRLTCEMLFDFVDIPPAQIHPINNTLSPSQAAQAYQVALQNVFANSGNRFPRFDLILLGMGEDGHTASLFPNHPLLNESKRWVAEILDSPKPPPERITLTLPVINNARQVAFLAAGAGKADILPQVLQTKTGSILLPAQRVQPANGTLHWYIDNLAAANLPHTQ